MKRALILIALVSVLALPAFSIGVGAAFSVDVIGEGLPSNVMFSMYAPEYFPAVVGLGVYVGQETFSVGITGDWWMYRDHLVGMLNLYAGLGFYADISQNVGLGGRVPIGLQIYPVEFLELFVEVAPKFGATLNPIVFPVWGVQSAVGFRFWF
jgi:hypothetical protein